MKKGIIIVVVIVIAVFGLGIVLFRQDAKVSQYKAGQDKSLPLQGQDYPIVGRNHISPGQSHEPYNSNPPTSGPHYAQPANWGVYQNTLADETLIHNLEHGGIWISYKNVDEATKAKLEAIGKANPGGVVVEPRPANDAKIALASWGRLLKLESFDETKILDFIKANKNNSPEPLAR